MEDPYELALAMLGMVITALLLVVGELYLVATPKPEPSYTPPATLMPSAMRYLS
jgi:hypothetical protein